MLILIAALGGAVVSGGLLILSHHLQAKRDDRRQQRDFERGIRGESLGRVKHAVDLGPAVTAYLHRISSGGEITDTGLSTIHGFSAALDGALVSAIAIGEEQLKDDIVRLSGLMQQIASAVSSGTLQVTLLGDAIDSLAHIEARHIEIKIRF